MKPAIAAVIRRRPGHARPLHCALVGRGTPRPGAGATHSRRETSRHRGVGLAGLLRSISRAGDL